MQKMKLILEEFDHSTITCPVCEEQLEYYSKVPRNAFIKNHYKSCLVSLTGGANYLSFPISTAIFPRDF